ncbi:MAG TPA: pilus assembly protein PilM [Candidatus Babeliales bacterium]|nr:pilus assembly protein PilM [Candidatus Babeliales bacterium]
MIKNVLIPESFGNYAIFPKRIIGIYIEKTEIHATQILLKGATKTIERYATQYLENGTSTNYNERVSQAIRALIDSLDPYDEIYTSLSSSLVFFKEIRLPFIKYQQIKSVIEFEVEPLLPFSLQDAVIDFIITKQIPEEKSSEILIAAVPKQTIAEHVQFFNQAGIDPTVVTVDLFALYGLFNDYPAYSTLAEGTAIIYLGLHSTQIAYLYDGQLRLIRSLPKGIFTIAKTASTTLAIDATEVMESLTRFGLEKPNDPQYNAAISSALSNFWNEIIFTLNSFATQTVLHQTIKQIFLLGEGARIHKIEPFAQAKTGIPCEQLQIQKIIEALGITPPNKNNLPQANIISISTALQTSKTKLFNLRKKELSVVGDASLFYKQCIVACSLIILLFGLLTAHSFFQTRKLNNAAAAYSLEAKEIIEQQFKGIESDNLEDMVDDANRLVQKEEKLWFAFNPGRASFLEYILELTNRIDKEALGFTIDRLHIIDTTMTITAHVKDHDALIVLEKELGQSKLLKQVGKQQSPNFTMTIKLAPNI